MTVDSERSSKLKIIAISGLIAAFVFIGTEIHVPTAIGYINLGDAVILVASFLLGPAACIPAAVGSALGDLIAGYAVYIGPTFVIKGAMGAVAGLVYSGNCSFKKSDSCNGKCRLIRRIAAAVAAEAILCAGYFAFESILYGVPAAGASVVFNCVQAIAGIVLATPLTYAIRVKL